MLCCKCIFLSIQIPRRRERQIFQPESGKRIYGKVNDIDALNDLHNVFVMIIETTSEGKLYSSV